MGKLALEELPLGGLEGPHGKRADSTCHPWHERLPVALLYKYGWLQMVSASVTLSAVTSFMGTLKIVANSEGQLPQDFKKTIFLRCASLILSCFLLPC